jgi:WD40 repeat protein
MAVANDDAATAEEIMVLPHHPLSIVDLLPDGSRIVYTEPSLASAAFSPAGSRIVTASADKTARIWDVHLQTMSVKDLLAEACAHLAGQTKLTRDEMRLASCPDSMPEIDVCR